MFGTKYDTTYHESPEDLWVIASTRRREVWLKSRGFHVDYAIFKYNDLPMYIQNRWVVEV